MYWKRGKNHIKNSSINSVEGPVYLTETHWFFLWKKRELHLIGQNGTVFGSKKSSKKLSLRGICEQIVQCLQNNFHI
jgi:hypothetical protein